MEITLSRAVALGSIFMVGTVLIARGPVYHWYHPSPLTYAGAEGPLSYCDPSHSTRYHSDSVCSENDVAHYLGRFGYVAKKMEDKMDLGSSDGHEAIKRFQRKSGLPQTGNLDSVTMKTMNSPRCGDPDTWDAFNSFSSPVPETNRTKRAVKHVRSRWPKNVLTWKVLQSSNHRSLKGKEAEVERILQNACQIWSAKTSLKFRKAVDSETPDLKIKFALGYHGDESPFDDPDQNIAHAFSPIHGLKGEIHFGDDQPWRLRPSKFGQYLLATAVHELGHALGMLHSRDTKDIMHALYQNHVELSDNDIREIQSMYGTPGNPRKAMAGSGRATYNINRDTAKYFTRHSPHSFTRSHHTSYSAHSTYSFSGTGPEH
ncbi:Macrophage metalloelastase [Halotydeus destructor]|nr:Macrophage metalloelastase [Halotydeus destructor]